MAHCTLISMLSLLCLLFSVAAQESGSAVLPTFVVPETRFIMIGQPCSHTCGGRGTRIVAPQCVHVGDLGEDEAVDSGLCAGQDRPPARREACNRDKCPGRWTIGEAGPCSSTCIGTQSIDVYCSQEQADSRVVRVNNAICERDDIRIKPLTSRACGTECADYKWNYYAYGDCESKCGPGIQTRDYECIKSTPGVTIRVQDSECTSRGLGNPITTRPCDPPNDCRYNITEWNKCSVTCGFGKQTRTATCYKQKQVNGRIEIEIVTLDECAKDPLLVLPLLVRMCHVPCPCEIPRWNVGFYSACPVSCGGGPRAYQTRYVDCTCQLGGRTQVTSDSDCKGQVKPASRRPCGADTCPCVNHHWVRGSYSDCSLTCSEVEQYGKRERKVECVCYRDGVREVANETQCHQRSKPVTTMECYPPLCPCLDPVWVTGPYDVCSKACNGIQIRDVSCQCSSNNRTLDDSVCLRNPKLSRPSTIRRCDDDCVCRNYYYTTGDWSYCSVTCGQGIQSRNVKCSCERENVYEDVKNKTLCEEQTGEQYPDEQRDCSTTRCPCNYQYVLGSWSKCIPDTCIGYQTRNVSCECEGAEVDILYCDFQHVRKPKETNRCDKCVFMWVPGPWSERYRRDVCKNVNTGGMVSKGHCYARATRKRSYQS